MLASYFGGILQERVTGTHKPVSHLQTSYDIQVSPFSPPSHCPWSIALKSDCICSTMKTVYHENHICPWYRSLSLPMPAVPWVSQQCCFSHREEINGLFPTSMPQSVTWAKKFCLCLRFWNFLLNFNFSLSFCLQTILKPYHPLDHPRSLSTLTPAKTPSFLFIMKQILWLSVEQTDSASWWRP